MEASYTGSVHPTELSPGNEVYMRWYPDFVRWHTYWFGGREQTRIETDSMQLMERFLAEKETWMILPISAVRVLKERKKVRVLPMRDGPGLRITYLLLHDREEQSEELQIFLRILKDDLISQEIHWLAKEDCFTSSRFA